MRVLALAALALLLADAADAQRHRDRPIAEQGDVALTAEIGPLSDAQLVPLLGGVGVRYRLSDATVFGASVGGGVSTSEDEVSVGDGDEVRTQRVERTDASGRLAVWLEQHLGRGRGPVSPFVGAGLRAGAGSTTTEFRAEASCVTCDPAPLTSTTESDSWSVGGALFLGAEVRLARSVTLGAAYQLGLTYATSEVEVGAVDSRPEPSVQQNERSFLSLGTSLSRLTLSVYL